MRSHYKPERKAVQQVTGEPAIRRLITILQARVAECERFYPWPALADSWRADIKELQARLNDPAH